MYSQTVQNRHKNFYGISCPELFSVYYHTSHGSLSVVRTTFKVDGKMQNLTLNQPQTPEPIITKFE